jgi:archaemetzincin
MCGVGRSDELMRQKVLVPLACILALTGCNRPKLLAARSEPPGLPLVEIENSLRPMAKELGLPEPGDWLSAHKEDGQTFADYMKVHSKRRNHELTTIYLLLLGDFSSEQREVLDITQRYLSTFYQKPVKLHRQLPLDAIPEDACRIHSSWGTKQISSAYVQQHLLRAERPEDALAYLCFTSSDLFSNSTRNYVLGEASFNDRTGVWSIYRNGDPTEGQEAFRRCLRRTMHIATHETGHILTVRHCTAFQCNMNGANSVSETDRHSLHFCPVCLRKLLWNLDAEPDAYLAGLEQFCREQELGEEVEWYAEARMRLQNVVDVAPD